MVVAVDYASPKDLRENLETFLTKEKDGKTYRGFREGRQPYEFP